MTHAQVIGKAIEVVEDAVEADESYWSEIATGQDTEEAEHSGYLVGYRDALSAVHALVAHNDETTLRVYLDSIESMKKPVECQGHPASPFDPMGQTVYCDGSCR